MMTNFCKYLRYAVIGFGHQVICDEQGALTSIERLGVRQSFAKLDGTVRAQRVECRLINAVAPDKFIGGRFDYRLSALQ